MNLPKTLSAQILNIPEIKYVLDIGFNFPFNLIELFHIHKAKKCIGVDIKSRKSSVSGMIADVIAEKSKIDKQKVYRLIQDEDIERQMHNSYKLYTSLILDEQPLAINDFNRNIQLYYSNSIQDYLKNENKWMLYDIIIVSKILSHIDPETIENWEWILDKLLDKLSIKA